MSQINTSQLVRVKVQPRHFECKIVQFNKLWWRNVLVIHQNDIKLHRGNTVFQRKWILEDDRTQICFNSRKLKRNQLLLEGFSIKMSACVLYSLLLSWACSFGHGHTSSPAARANASYGWINSPVKHSELSVWLEVIPRIRADMLTHRPALIGYMLKGDACRDWSSLEMVQISLSEAIDTKTGWSSIEIGFELDFITTCLASL